MGKKCDLKIFKQAEKLCKQIKEEHTISAVHLLCKNVSSYSFTREPKQITDMLYVTLLRWTQNFL